MGVPTEEGDGACSTAVSADEKQSVGITKRIRSATGFILTSPRRHRRDDFIINSAWSKLPSDKIIEIIHPTSDYKYTRQKNNMEKRQPSMGVATFTRRRPSSSICWGGAIDESAFGPFPIGKTSRTAGSIWGTTPP